MASEHRPWTRQGEVFWRAHHEAWKRSDLNQREYCEVHGLTRKGFENWRAKFKAEPQPPVRKLLYRRGGLSHRLSHTVGHSARHMTNDELSRPIVPSAREGHRRAFSHGDKRRIVAEAAQPGANLSAVARSYGIAARILFRWKQELAPEPTFVTVGISDANGPRQEECAP
jgi:Transposase